MPTKQQKRWGKRSRRSKINDPLCRQDGDSGEGMMKEWAEAFGVAILFIAGAVVMLLVKLRWFWLALVVAILVVPVLT